MKDILLLICVLLAFGIGYLPMRRLDRYLDRNREAAGEEQTAERAPRRERRMRQLGGGLSLNGWRGARPLRHRL